ncbi:hypothetical protein [Chondromyces apiculatus]|uniref:Lipoprotein n=1 Tax=Chondromyces apiculatus DSM 436 TaxID=1192034 RepID=A0A017TDR6_9BACT|nr:hypothetical protein [Chondromyces apiculatus]EYF07394.1 Hypothetical protein CAP_0147 [Chondromyces apiculatus DSM 436]
MMRFFSAGFGGLGGVGRCGLSLACAIGAACAIGGLGACAQSSGGPADGQSTVELPVQTPPPGNGSGAQNPTGGATPPGQVTPNTQPPGQQGDPALVGTWKSASCGDRTYERTLTFGADGTFQASDRISPCPPRAQCVWSGIVDRNGSYVRSGNTITLRVEGTPGKQGKPLPETLTVDPTTSAPTEQGSSGPCVYTR